MDESKAVDMTLVESEVEVVVTAVVPGDVITICEDGDTILVKTARPVGSFIQFTAFGHPQTDRWYVYKGSTVHKKAMSFVTEQDLSELSLAVEVYVQGRLELEVS